MSTSGVILNKVLDTSGENPALRMIVAAGDITVTAENLEVQL